MSGKIYKIYKIYKDYKTYTAQEAAADRPLAASRLTPRADALRAPAVAGETPTGCRRAARQVARLEAPQEAGGAAESAGGKIYKIYKAYKIYKLKRRALAVAGLAADAARGGARRGRRQAALIILIGVGDFWRCRVS